MTSTIPKGEQLEKAVLAIESLILATSPSYSDKTFRIECRKTVTVDGVRHEVDLWVEVNLGSGYRTLFLFECKNWEASVGKNELMVFSGKISALSAQGGFFVAKSFTRYAEAQAKLDPRITLLTANSLPIKNLSVPFDFHFVCKKVRHANIQFRRRGASTSGTPQPLEVRMALATLRGEELDLAQFVRDWVPTAIEEAINRFPSETKPEGEYSLDAVSERYYDPGELVVEGHDMEQASLRIDFSATVVRPGILASFDIESRGRAITLAPVSLPGGAEITVTFAEA